MKFLLGELDIPDFQRLPIERREALVAEVNKEVNTPALDRLPFRGGAVLTMLVIAVLFRGYNASMSLCVVAGLVAMLFGVLIGVPVKLLIQRRLLERQLRERIQADIVSRTVSYGVTAHLREDSGHGKENGG